MRVCIFRSPIAPLIDVSAKGICLTTLLAALLTWSAVVAAQSVPQQDELQIDVVPKGLGKEVSIRKGNREWFMLIEVTVDNTVVVRQEKENDRYLMDESETHDRALTKAEVDVAIEDFINSVKSRLGRKGRDR
jgi:hypothetical protein